MASTDGGGGADCEETQVLDLDSQAPGEVPILYGETQVDDSDGSDDEGGGEIDERGKTQLVDDYEETPVVRSGSQDTDGTEVLSYDEGLAGDGPAHCGVRENGGSVECEMEARVIGGNDLCSGDNGKDDLVDSDASTDGGDDDGDAGSSRRSFAAVRMAAVRSSGLAAAQHFSSRSFGNLLSSFSNSKHIEKKGTAVHLQRSLTGSGNNLKMSEKEPSCLTTIVGKLDLDNGSANFEKSPRNYYQEETKSRCCNKRIKRLFSELLPSEQDGNTGEDDNIISKMDMPNLLATDYISAGLSYVASQDPSDLSQANALEIVDKFLSINDAGLSQEMRNVETDILKTPPVSVTKGIQLLAEKSDCRSPIGKQGIFDWDDLLEDEGGGEFFIKRKNSFFEETCGARKTRSHPPESRHTISGTTKCTVDKRGKKGSKLRTGEKGGTLVHSDSRLMIPNPGRSDKIHISETNTGKNLFKDANGESNAGSLQHQLGIGDVEGGLEGTCDVGPDTQMAAEAMESLLHGSLVNAEKDIGHPAAEINPIMNTPSNNVSQQKRTFVNDSNVIMTRSKMRKMLFTKSNNAITNTQRVYSTSSRMKSTSENKVVKRQAQRAKVKPDGQADNTSFTNGQNTPKSTKKEKTQAMVARHLGEQRENSDILVDRPCAYYTRHSKRVKLFKQNETLPNDRKESDELIEANVSMDLEVMNNLVTNRSESVEAEGLYLTTGVNEYPTTQAKLLNCDPPREEFEASLPTKDGSHYPKQRRTSRPSGKLNVSLNKPSSMPGIGEPEAIDISSKKGGKKKIFIRSVSDILDKVKRKRRSSHMSFQTDRDPSSATVVRLIFGMTARSLVKPNSLKPSSDREELSRTSTHTNVQNHSSKPVEDSEQNEDTKVKLHNLTCTTPSKDINSVSPVCTAKDTPGSCNKVISASLGFRELRRLENAGASTPTVKDLRRRKDMASVRVLFSQHLVEDTIKQQKKVLSRLGLQTASSISDATHFVTDKFVRTQKMLEAIAAGKPVVTPMWLENCGQASCFMDEKNYILRDVKKEKEIGFNMPVSLSRACQRPLLQGRRVYITPNVKPNRELVSSLVKASHGQAIKRIGRSAMKEDKVPDDLLVLSCEEDYSICIPLLEKGAGIFSSELLLNGIVIQKLEYERHRLFLDHVKQTRSTIWLRHKDRDQFFPVSKCA